MLQAAKLAGAVDHDGDHVDPPHIVVATLRGEIALGESGQALDLGRVDALFGHDRIATNPRLDLDEDNFRAMLKDQVQLAELWGNVVLCDQTIALPGEMLRGEILTPRAELLSRQHASPFSEATGGKDLASASKAARTGA